MGRNKGTFNYSANFEPRLESPLDARLVVDEINDLINPITWQDSDSLVWLYNGMPVSVTDPSTRGIYVLIDKDNYTSFSAWEKIAADASINFIDVGDGSAKIFAGIDASDNIRLRSISGIGAAIVSEVGDLITVSIDASFSGDTNLAENIGTGEGTFSQKRLLDNALLFKSLDTSAKTIIIYSDSSTIYFDISTNLFLTESSLGTTLYWTNGVLNVSTGYVDGSLSLRDASITELYINGDNQLVYIDGSLAQQKIYIDGSLSSRDASIQQVFILVNDLSANTSYWKLYVDGSLSQYLRESSINFSTDFIWNASSLLSINRSLFFDSSYNELYDMIIENSTNIGGVNYDSSNFITSGNDLQTSVSNLDSIMGLLAPAKPNMLTGLNLVLSNSTVYTAKLPTGLTSTWYYDSLVPGTTITDYSIDNSFRMTTPSFIDTFRAGFLSNTDTRGNLFAYINNSQVATYDMTTGFGNSSFVSSEAAGMLRFNNEAGYGGINSDFWRRAEAYIDITAQQEGGVKYAIGHSEAAISNYFFLRYDPSPGLAKWLVPPSTSEGSLNLEYLSGLPHYGINSTINVSFSANSGIFKHAYHATNVARVTSIYGSQRLLNPITAPAYDASFSVSNDPFTFNISNMSSGSSYPSITVSLFKPHLNGDVSTLTLTKRLNTYSPTRATAAVEYFTDESRRLLTASSGPDTSWDNEDIAIFLANGPYAQVQNGLLRYPVSSDYSGTVFTGDKEYIRRFTKTTGSLSSGTLTFIGFNPLTDSSAYGLGNVNLILWLTDQNIYFDLAKEYGTGGDGTSISTAKGAWTARSSSSIAWSLGTISLGSETTHTNQFALIIIFKNNNETIAQITLS